MNEDKATRYHRRQRTAGVLSLVWLAAVLATLVATGASAWLRDSADRLASLVSPAPSSTHALSVVLVYVWQLMAITELAGLPFAFYSGFVMEQRYGLSTERLSGWVSDQLKGLAVLAVLGSVAATIVYAFIRRTPDDWWLPTGVIFAVLVVGLANVGPLLLLPLFYTIKPIDRESLRARLVALADRAGARVLGAYEWGLSAKTKKANAALTGLGSTRRILVSDTMLADYSEDEIEVVLAHEIAHHVHGDIWKVLTFDSALILAGCFMAAQALSALARWAGLQGPADVAGLPLLLLAAGTVSVVMVPAAYAMARAFERRADRFALELTRNPLAFISAMRRLGAQNLAEEQPSKLVEWLFYNHPPIRDRIAAAEAFKG